MNLTVQIKRNPQKLNFSFVDNVIMETIKLIQGNNKRKPKIKIKIRRKTKIKAIILMLLNQIQLMKLVVKKVFLQLKIDQSPNKPTKR